VLDLGVRTATAHGRTAYASISMSAPSTTVEEGPPDEIVV
jgi:hypothetical protein